MRRASYSYAIVQTSRATPGLSAGAFSQYTSTAHDIRSQSVPPHSSLNLDFFTALLLTPSVMHTNFRINSSCLANNRGASALHLMHVRWDAYPCNNLQSYSTHTCGSPSETQTNILSSVPTMPKFCIPSPHIVNGASVCASDKLFKSARQSPSLRRVENPSELTHLYMA